jgi:hypothetical protein
MKKTIVLCEVLSMEKSRSYLPDHPVATKIKLGVPYDPKSVFYQMSGGSGFELNTVSQGAADLFELGSKVEATFRIVPEHGTGLKLETVAMELYDSYCEAVGGVAFNGDKLPGSIEFFADQGKEKQANAWRAAALKAAELIY